MKGRLRSWMFVLLGGVLLPISFCGFDQWYLTWIAFVPLLAAIEGATRRQAAWRGFVYGLIANQIGYYWIPYTIHEFGHFPQALAILFSLLLCAYQAVQYSLLAYLTNRLRERRWPLLLVFPAVMVGLETVYPLLFPIFMGNTQHAVPLLIQASDVLGPLLITFVILLFNASIFIGVNAALRKTAIPWRQVAAGPAALALLIVYGALRIPQIEAAMEQGTDLRVGIVQPNMGILEKWRDVEEGLRRHEERSLDLERRGADLILWSEASYTAGYVDPTGGNLRRLLVPDLHTPLLAGALTRHRDENGRRRRHNSAIMLDAEGNVLGSYDKNYLLAFGEYLPFGELFPQIYEASPNTGRLQPGTHVNAVPFDFGGRRWNLGVLICYEDIIPQFTRTLMRNSSPALLVNMTNDAWFGDTNEPWIHMDLAKFRAVEHRRYLVRATNTGVSTVIDPVGRVQAHSEVFVQASMLETVRLLDGGPTLYALAGDILGWLALLGLAIGAVLTREVWLRAPARRGRAGVRQAGLVTLLVGIYALLALAFTAILAPGEWTPGALEWSLWTIAISVHLATFVLARKRHPWTIRAGWTGAATLLALALDLVVQAREGYGGAVLGLMGLPAALSLAAAATLWLWRERVGAHDASPHDDGRGREGAPPGDQPNADDAQADDAQTDDANDDGPRRAAPRSKSKRSTRGKKRKKKRP